MPISLVLILALVVLIAYANHRWIQLNTTIAVMSAAMIISAALLIVQHTKAIPAIDFFINPLLQIDFRNLLLNVMLGLLLFAGGLTINLDSLKKQKWEIGILSSISTIGSTLMVGTLIFYFLPLIGLYLPYLYCLLFGALISPTDPVAVLAIFKKTTAPKSLYTCIAGESLFNDGVGIVIFMTLYQLVFQHVSITVQNVVFLFFKQSLCGLGYGLLLGAFLKFLIKKSNDDKLVILLTLAAATSGYSLANALGISGPLAMVVAGIYLSDVLKESQHLFWEVIDEVLNAVLFLLLGFELLSIHVSQWEWVAMLVAIPLVLLTRLITVAVPMRLLAFHQKHPPHTIAILTWGGLRGGLAVALALSLPAGPFRDFILAMTFSVVSFSVIFQGVSIKSLLNRLP